MRKIEKLETTLPNRDHYLFPDDEIPGLSRDELLKVISANLDDAMDATDGSDINSDVRIDYAQDIIEQARDALVDEGYEFSQSEQERMSFLSWPLTPEQEKARAAKAEREAVDLAAHFQWRDSTQAKFNRYLALAMNGEALPPESNFSGLKIEIGWSSWTSTWSGESTVSPSGDDVGKMVDALINSGCADARIAAYSCSRVGVTFETDPCPGWTIDFSVPVSIEAWQLLRVWWDENRMQHAPHLWYSDPGVFSGNYCHWSFPDWPARGAPENWRYGYMSRPLENLASQSKEATALTNMGRDMNYDQYRDLLKISKPLYAQPTLFGISHRSLVVAVIAIALAVAVMNYFKS